MDRSDPDRDRARDNRRGIRLMVLSIAAFVANDSLVKLVSETLPAGQLIFVRGVMATLLVLFVARQAGVVHLSLGTGVRGWVAVRAVVDALATFAYLLSLFHLPIASATAINMATPLVITLLAVLLLGERVGAWRWLAIAGGFAGVLLIIRPSAGGFNAWAWLCLLGTVLHAVRDLVTPRIAAAVPSIVVTLATAATVTVMAGAIVLVQGWVAMTVRQTALLAGAAVFLAAGYHLVVRATRIGELSVVAPFRYTGLLIAVLLGWVFWGEVPDAIAWAGIALVIGAGLYLLRQARG